MNYTAEIATDEQDNYGVTRTRYFVDVDYKDTISQVTETASSFWTEAEAVEYMETEDFTSWLSARGLN